MGGGGGGNTTTTTSGVPEFAKPYLQEVLGDVTKNYREEAAGGHQNVVAGLSPEQKQAMAAQTAAASNAIAGTGAYDNQAAVQHQLANLAGMDLAGQANTGTLGSARANRARQSALADQALNMQNQRKQDISAGVQALSNVGDKRQQQRQLELDAPHTSAQRYFGYLGSTGQESKASQGGGK